MRKILIKYIQNIGVSILVLLLCIYGIKYYWEENLQNLVQSSGAIAPIVFILLKISTIVFAPLSGTPLFIVAWSLFGVGPAIVLLVIGDAIGYSIAFFLSRHFGRKYVEDHIAKNESGLLHKIVKNISSVKGFIVTCFLFIYVTDLLAYGAWLSRLPYKYFFPIFVTGDLIAIVIVVLTSNHIGVSYELVLYVSLVALLISVISWWIQQLSRRTR